MTATPNLAATALATAVETAVGAAIALDAPGIDRFAELRGRRIRFSCASPALDHTWIIGEDRLLIAAGDPNPVDVEASAPLPQLLRLLLRPDQPPDAAVEISGNASVLDQLLATLANLRPDLAPVLAPALGGDAAAGADAIAGSVLRTAREVGDLARTQLSAALQKDGDVVGAVRDGLEVLAARLRQPPGHRDDAP